MGRGSWKGGRGRKRGNGTKFNFFINEMNETEEDEKVELKDKLNEEVKETDNKEMKKDQIKRKRGRPRKNESITNQDEEKKEQMINQKDEEIDTQIEKKAFDETIVEKKKGKKSKSIGNNLAIFEKQVKQSEKENKLNQKKGSNKVKKKVNKKDDRIIMSKDNDLEVEDLNSEIDTQNMQITSEYSKDNINDDDDQNNDDDDQNNDDDDEEEEEDDALGEDILNENKLLKNKTQPLKLLSSISGNPQQQSSQSPSLQQQSKVDEIDEEAVLDALNAGISIEDISALVGVDISFINRINGYQIQQLHHVVMYFAEVVCMHIQMKQRSEAKMTDYKIIEMQQLRVFQPSKSVADYIMNMPKGEKIVVFSQWTTCLDVIEDVFHHFHISFCRFDGTQSVQQQHMSLNAFKIRDSHGPIVLLASLKAGGVGLNLIDANHVLLVDKWWNPFIEEQAIDRVHRIGQIRPVHVMRLTCVMSIEERIEQLQVKKIQTAEQILQDSANAYTETIDNTGGEISAERLGRALTAQDYAFLLGGRQLHSSLTISNNRHPIQNSFDLSTIPDWADNPYTFPTVFQN
ncbi:MAG: putative dna repair protein rad5 [Streblomastix strix]|uniref:Putative dna repair protein rad5 n=1 Tax=Streblomastix strix TaxID=222440 RepID=A0A5J4VSE9_9EUKA|nr:MAG: putative dna repair protein rad5 [Streblomastix strix]